MAFPKIFIFLFLTASLLLLNQGKAESVLDEEEEEDTNTQVTSTSENAPQLFTENIQKISESERIFIISNNNSSFAKGDFISLLINNELVARALCAKQLDNLAGIKILKIYSDDLWKKLHPNMDVQVLRGDDSFWKNLKANEGKAKQAKDDSKIKEEDDLYNETKIEDDSSFDENKNRAIKPDNILSMGYSWIDARNNDGSAAKVTQFIGQWAYQITDNVWGEVLYGQGIMNDYPSPGLDTKLTNTTIRAKYTFNAPLYSFLMPYVGYQMIGASSPGAGVEDTSSNFTPADYAAEINRVDDLKKNSFIFGVTALKRIVPGWFLRADVGMDILSVGASLEF